MAVLDFDQAVGIRLQNMKPDFASGYRTHTHDVSLALAGFQMRRAHIKKTRVPEEQKTKIAEAAVTVRQTFAAKRTATFDRLQARIEDERRTAEAKLAAGDPKENEVLKFLRHQEIRTRVAATDPVMHQSLLGKAVEAGDRDFLDALRSAPRAFPTVDPNLLREMTSRVVAAANPEIAELEQLADAYRFVFSVAGEHVREALREEGIEEPGEITILK